MAALEPSVRMLVKNTALSASSDTVVSLAFRELLKYVKGISWKVESGSKMKTDGQATALLETKAVRSYDMECGLTCMDKAISFNARKYHMLEKHRGNMWAPYTPQTYKHAHESHVAEIMELSFPVSPLSQFRSVSCDCPVATTLGTSLCSRFQLDC